MTLPHMNWQTSALILAFSITCSTAYHPNSTITLSRCERAQCSFKPEEASIDCDAVPESEKSLKEQFQSWYKDNPSEEFLQAMYEMELFAGCMDKCKISNWFKYWRLSQAQRLKEIMYASEFMSAVNYAIGAFYALFLTPIVMLSNYVNAKVLHRVMVNTQSASIHFHIFDAVSDSLVVIVLLVQVTELTLLLLVASPRCGDDILNKWYYRANYHIPFGVLTFLVQANQLCNFFIVIDRYFAITRPFVYKLHSTRANAMKAIGIALIYSFIIGFFEPGYLLGLAFIHKDVPAEKYWKDNRPQVDAVGIGTAIIQAFSFSLVFFLTIFFSVKLGVAWKEMSKKREAFLRHQEAQATKYQNGQQLRLMVGTVSVSTISIIPLLADKLFWMVQRLDMVPEAGTTYYILLLVKYILAPFTGFGACSSVIVHIIFTETYRQAFFETFKCIKQKSMTSSVQPLIVGGSVNRSAQTPLNIGGVSNTGDVSSKAV